MPLSTQVETSTPETLHVVEASSFQLESTTTFKPWMAVWLNLADDHLDRHVSFEAYGRAKARVFANQTSTDWAFLNADDALVMRYGRETLAVRVPFSVAGSIADGFVVEGEWIVRRTGTDVERLVPLEAVQLTWPPHAQQRPRRNRCGSHRRRAPE